MTALKMALPADIKICIDKLFPTVSDKQEVGRETLIKRLENSKKNE